MAASAVVEVGGPGGDLDSCARKPEGWTAWTTGRSRSRPGWPKEEALDLIRAALEQLSGGESRELALDLPIELAGHVTQHDGQAHPQPLRDFTRHPRERTGLNQDEVTRGLRVVLATLSGLPDSARVRHALGRLPAEYRELAGTGA
ncbi:DUF2267 domain-containing protein [Dactylosporangium sp. NPDC000244]|uniref:DUF2267 domain-containing protein n=1 Tax=Dactylosporangium sp. NPDC000244 TaxID=3154365 RepID=UPI003321CA02